MASECRKQPGGSINRPREGAVCSGPTGTAAPNFFGNGAAVLPEGRDYILFFTSS